VCSQHSRGEKLMTIRRLASAILTAAVRRASPGVREWGTAMLREMDFVESDWAALLWAIGSVPVLFKHSEAPMIDPSDVFLRAQALMKKVRRRTLMGYGACIIATVYFASFIFVPNTLQRIGCCLAIPATLYLAYQLYAPRPGDLPLESGLSACTDSYRAELERQRDFHRGTWLWSRLAIIFPSYMLFYIGFLTAHPEFGKGFAAACVTCLIILGIVAVPGNLRLSRKYQRQIDELDALPKDS
jgi:hypothetical protein